MLTNWFARKNVGDMVIFVTIFMAWKGPEVGQGMLDFVEDLS